MTEQPSSSLAGRVAAMSSAGTAGAALARARAEHATPPPAVGDLWRARWEDQALPVLVIAYDAEQQLRVAPVSLDTEPDETAVLASAADNTLAFDAAIWSSDAADVPVRVLDYKLGHLTSPVEELPAGTSNWGPTDPRTLVRARLQDLVEYLTEARWAPRATSDLDLDHLLADVDPASLAPILGTVAKVRAFRRGQLSLTPDEATQLAEILNVGAHELLVASQPPLPKALVTAMDSPNVRSLVDQLARRRNRDETSTWASAAYGVIALAARDHDRRDVQWASRIRAYFEAQLRDPGPGEDR